MADPILHVDRNKQQDDHWTTGDANLGPRASERHDPALDVHHSDSGEHLLPAPEAAAYVTFDSGTNTYALDWSKNVASVVRVSTGLVKITLSNSMRDADHWTACAYPDAAEHFGSEEDATFLKTQTTTQVQIYSSTTFPGDSSFLLVVYGVRL